MVYVCMCFYLTVIISCTITGSSGRLRGNNLEKIEIKLEARVGGGAGEGGGGGRGDGREGGKQGQTKRHQPVVGTSRYHCHHNHQNHHRHHHR